MGVLALAPVAAGCGDRAGSGPPQAAPAAKLVGPAQFAATVRRPGTVTLNVHVPDEGDVPGTDLAIPFDRLRARRRELPPRTTPLAVYCRSGRMSRIAVQTLRQLGFRRITELRGGMEAWRASGRSLVP